MKVTPELLKKYAEQQCSEKERDAVEQWLKTMNEVEDHEEVPTSSFLEEKLWGNIKLAIVNELTKEKKIFYKKTLWAIAASIVLFIGLGTFQIVSNSNKTITYRTLSGETQNITLSDGTFIHLNVNSVLKAPKVFTGDKRLVSLVGEAYFEVSKDSLHPFIVETEKTKTTVLGTKFNLSVYPSENPTLTLKEGKVSFKDKNTMANELILLPNEQSTLDHGILKKNMVSPEYYIGWRKNILYFNNETLGAITRKLERVYDVKIQINNEELNNRTYRGVYRNSKLENLLEDLSFVLKFKYTKEGKHIIIY